MQMRGLAVFVVFFAIFLASSIVISSPLFPGNTVCFLLGILDFNQVSVLSAIVNGIFYGFIVWIVFSLSFRWAERSLSEKKLVEKKS